MAASDEHPRRRPRPVTHLHRRRPAHHRRRRHTAHQRRSHPIAANRADRDRPRRPPRLRHRTRPAHRIPDRKHRGPGPRPRRSTHLRGTHDRLRARPRRTLVEHRPRPAARRDHRPRSAPDTPQDLRDREGPGSETAGHRRCPHDVGPVVRPRPRPRPRRPRRRRHPRRPRRTHRRAPTRAPRRRPRTGRRHDPHPHRPHPQEGLNAMATTAECTIEVPLVDFRRAVAAVKPHAERTKTSGEVSAFNRVRFIAAKDELYVAATNGTTAALAAVEILEDSRATRFAKDDGSFADAEEDDQVAALRFTETTVAARDVSGLWPGAETIRPALAYSADYPNLVGILAKALGTAGEAVKPLTTPGTVVALFASASRQYGRPLQFEASGPADSRGYIVWCGPGFIGSVSSGHDDGDSLARRQSERRAHLERLGLAPALAEIGADA